MEQNGFGVVVGMVGEANYVVAVSIGNVVYCFVSELACRRLYALSGGKSVSLDVYAFYKTGYSVFRAVLLYEIAVESAFGAKVVIDRDYGEVFRRHVGDKRVQHNHTVYASGNCQKVLFVRISFHLFLFFLTFFPSFWETTFVFRTVSVGFIFNK